MKEPIFRNYARYYDLLYADKDYVSEAKFVRALLKNYAPKTVRILELGCGTGRHAAHLAANGYRVQGIDLSRDMLKRCNALVTQVPAPVAARLAFSQGDMRNLRLHKKFDAVISLFNVICYQTSNADLRAAFETARSHIKRGGLFMFDCWYGPAVLRNLPSVRIKRVEDEAIKITRIAEPRVYPNENRVDVKYTIFLRDKKTGKTDELKELHTVRYLFKPEIGAFLEAAGFSFIAAQEWITGKELDFDTWTGCFIARSR